MASTYKAQNKAKEILEKYVQKSRLTPHHGSASLANRKGVQNQTDVYKIAEKLGIEISSTDFSEEISGVLDLSGEQAKNFCQLRPRRIPAEIFYSP